MEIRGSGNKYYEVNISELTCTCRDWTCRRHNFPKGDNKRLCKHLVEAIELDSLINSNSIKFPGVPKLTNYEKIRLLSDSLRNTDIILSHSICGEYYRRGKYITEYIPIVVKFTYDTISYNMMDEALTGYNLSSTSDNGKKRIYNGDLPLLIIISNDNFLFKSIYYELKKDEFIRLSSISDKILGLRITENGFINNKNELINMNISTEDELCNLLKIDGLTW